MNKLHSLCVRCRQNGYFDGAIEICFRINHSVHGDRSQPTNLCVSEISIFINFLVANRNLIADSPRLSAIAQSRLDLGAFEDYR